MRDEIMRLAERVEACTYNSRSKGEELEAIAAELRALALTDHAEDKLGMVPEGWRCTVAKAADAIAYAAYNAFGCKLEDLDPGIVDSTAPFEVALIAERDLRAMLAADPAPDHSAGAGGSFDIYEAYKGRPDDLRKKLSLHDLRRMNGWVPANAVDPMAERSRKLIVGFMLDCNSIGMVGAAENLGKGIKEAALTQPADADAEGGK